MRRVDHHGCVLAQTTFNENSHSTFIGNAEPPSAQHTALPSRVKVYYCSNVPQCPSAAAAWSCHCCCRRVVAEADAASDTLLLGGLVGEALLLLAGDAGVGAGDTQRGVHAGGLHLVRDDRRGRLDRRAGDREERARVLHGVLGLLGRRVALLGLVDALAREDDELGLVRLEAVHVGLERLDRLVGAAEVDGDAHRKRLLAADASLLELLEREALARAHLGRVLDRLAVHGGAQQARGRARRDGRGLGLTPQAAGLLLGGLSSPYPQLVSSCGLSLIG